MKAICLIPFALMMIVGCKTDKTDPSGATSNTGTDRSDSPNRTYHLKDLEKVKLKVSGQDIPVWVMDDEGKRKEGMMWLTADDVADHDGMIFAFPDVQPPSNGFWMSNTILALDIIYISPKMKVLNIQEGRPHDETSLPSKGDYQFVLEMKQGGAEKFGIKPGTEIAIPATVKGK